MELPAHPEQDDDPGPASTTNWATALVIAVVVALLAALVILHLTGIVGPAGD
jgi:hypothetical protein